MNNIFKKAKPIWIAGRNKEMNVRAEFKAIVKDEKNAEIRIATSGIYHLTVNGKFIAYGPARTGRGYFRADRIDLSNLLNNGNNVIVIEVCGYYADSYCLIKQPSFLTAELETGDHNYIYTGKDFSVRVNPNCYQKVQRYSLQRPMLEAYHIIAGDTFITDETTGNETVEVVDAGIYSERYAPYPQYEHLPAKLHSSGNVSSINPEKYRRNLGILRVNSGELSGFPVNELSVFPSDECQNFKFTPSNVNSGSEITKEIYRIYEFKHNATGMLAFTVKSETPLTLYVLFDEILTNGTVNFLRGGCSNTVRIDIPKGVYNIQLFEAYTMKYVQLFCNNGKAEIENLHMVEIKHPPVKNMPSYQDPAVNRIAEAAVETFRQGAVDLFMDCPSRERAGWLCDSFFSGRTEYSLFGESSVEKSFLENFLCEERFENLPDGMFPMCYPADHTNGSYIPNWSLWLVLELNEYFGRTGDRELIERFRERIIKLFEFFKGFENEYGLLEKLPNWVFVEWSKANDFVQDVNYPSNMLYSAALKVAGNLYGIKDYCKKAEKLKEVIIKQSFNGQFFRDHAVRTDGGLEMLDDCSETCQYYAFFFEIASADRFADLFTVMLNDFGPNRNAETTYSDIYPSNAFIGNYLRLEILMRSKNYDKALQNIIDYFDYMAKRTGTLWEKISDDASCNHCFAGYVICWIKELYNRGLIK